MRRSSVTLRDIMIAPLVVVAAPYVFNEWERKNDAMVMKTVSQGLYDSCSKNERSSVYVNPNAPEFSSNYKIPQEINSPYSVSISYDMISTSAFSKAHFHSLSLKQNGISFNSLMRGSGVLIDNKGMFNGVAICDKVGSSFVTFKDKVVLKIPFRVTDLNTVKNKIDRNEIPWGVSTIPNHNARLEELQRKYSTPGPL